MLDVKISRGSLIRYEEGNSEAAYWKKSSHSGRIKAKKTIKSEI